MKDYNQVLFGTGSDELKPHLIGELMEKVWWSTRTELWRAYFFDREGVWIIKEMWHSLNSAHESLMNVPYGCANIDDELAVFISVMSHICSLLEDPRTENLQVIKQKVIDELRGLIPVLEGYIKIIYSHLRERSRLVEKVKFAIPSTETRIILKPLLLRFIDRNLFVVNFGTRGSRASEYLEVIKARWTSLLEGHLDGYIEAIQRGGSSNIGY